MIARLKCWLFGHRRGKRIADAMVQSGTALFECPRCKARWTRKAKA